MSKYDNAVFKKTAIAMSVSTLDQPMQHVEDNSTTLENSDYNWDDLNNLKDELGTSVIEFINQVTAISMNPEVISAIKLSSTPETGNKSEYLAKLVDQFMKDVDNFSKKVQATRVQHDGLSGKVTDVNQFNLYNRISINYQVLYTELVSLVSPTLTELVALVHEAQSQLSEQLQTTEQPITE